MISGYSDPDTGEWRCKSRGYLTEKEWLDAQKRIRNDNIKGAVVIFAIIVILLWGINVIGTKMQIEQYLEANGGIVIDKYIGRYDSRHIVIYNNGEYYTFEASNNEYYYYNIGDVYRYEG